MNSRKTKLGLQFLMALIALAVVIVGCGAGGGDHGAGQTEISEGPLAAPSTQDANAAPAEVDLVGAWLLEDFGGRGVVDMVRTTIEFDDEGQVFGSGGCNRFTGSYTLDDGMLGFGPLATTKMMCPEAVMDQEDRFLAALGAVERVEMDGPFLLIFFSGSEAPLRFTKADEIEI
jgi:heat shock protein HslJ